MTVLPQLEQELRVAHGRRRADHRRGHAVAWIGLTAAVAVALLVVAVAASVGGSRVRPSVERRATSGWTHLTIKHIDYLGGYAVSGVLYLVEGRTERPAGTTLVRLDARTAQVQAVLQLGATADDELLAGGCLWITTTTVSHRGRTTTTLWRLDPASLGVLSKTVLPGSGRDDGSVGSLAQAGSRLWVSNAGRLVRVSLATFRIDRVVPLAGAHGVDLTADSTGRYLLVSFGNGSGLGHVQRRDPVTGALVSSAAPFDGVSEPFLGGVIDRGVWLSEATGMEGYASRLDLETLRPTRVAPTLMYASNGIGVRVIDGVVWVYQVAGGAQRNYCADPITGRARALFAVRGETVFLTADSHSVYTYESPFIGGRPGQVILIRQPIPSRCR